MLSERTIAIVKQSVPALREHGLAITRNMYPRLFENAEIRGMFNETHQRDGSQPRALAASVLAYAENIDNLGALSEAVERIAQKHVALNILPEHYPHVGRALLAAIADVLGEAATPEVLAAWGEAYQALADVLIGREAALYRADAEAEGGWIGWRDFVVERVVPESEIITSFYLAPQDGGPVMAFQPGQYLTFRLDIPGHGHAVRNYSISCAPGQSQYRISVKREGSPAGQPDAAPGLVSTYLHDQVRPGQLLEVSAPAGEFFLDDTSERPVVLLSGGVGLTPMVSMAETIAARQPARPTWYIHGTYCGAHHAMRDHVRALAASHPEMRAVTFYERPRAEDVKGRDYDETGRISVEWLARHVPMAEADFYFCGPKPFLALFATGLRAAGVAAERIHYEFFGPADELWT